MAKKKAQRYINRLGLHLQRAGQRIRRSGFSNFGRLAVQIAAPGDNILSTSKTGGYEIMSGTSMAAPMVTGVAALAASVNPGISAVDLRAVLMDNATRSRLPVAAGYVDALHAVLAASTATGYDSTQPPRLSVPGDQTAVYDAPLSPPIDLSATDVEPADHLTFSAGGLPSGLTLRDNGDRTARVTGTPASAIPS